MPTENEPLLKWPNQESLWHAVMSRIWRTAKTEDEDDWSNEGDDAPVSPEEALLICPELPEYIRRAAVRFEPPDHVFQLLHELTGQAAEDLVREMPPEPKERLAAAMRERLNEPACRETLFSSVERFYQDDERRRGSPEADYGVHWRQSGHPGRLRVSYVKDTGELYAVNGANSTTILLGRFPADPEDPYYETLDRALEGWAAECPANPDGLSWIVGRLESGGGASYPQSFRPRTPEAAPVHFKLRRQSDITLCGEIAEEDPTTAMIEEVTCRDCTEPIAEIRRQNGAKG